MRKPRFLKAKAKYHVTARANRQEMILASDAFKELFLDVMRRAKKKYKFILFNFCLMGNHIHLILQPDHKTAPQTGLTSHSAHKGNNWSSRTVSLSRIMQWILSVFALKYNRICGIKGHVWYDRFHSVILNDIFQYLDTYIYVMRNPVKAGIVKKPDDYHYNGITFMLKGMMDLFMPS